jgi:hypothetical protein
VRLPALKGARALRKRAKGSIRYATLLERSQLAIRLKIHVKAALATLARLWRHAMKASVQEAVA